MPDFHSRQIQLLISLPYLLILSVCLIVFLVFSDPVFLSFSLVCQSFLWLCFSSCLCLFVYLYNLPSVSPFSFSVFFFNCLPFQAFLFNQHRSQFLISRSLSLLCPPPLFSSPQPSLPSHLPLHSQLTPSTYPRFLFFFFLSFCFGLFYFQIKTVVTKSLSPWQRSINLPQWISFPFSLPFQGHNNIPSNDPRFQQILWRRQQQRLPLHYSSEQPDGPVSNHSLSHEPTSPRANEWVRSVRSVQSNWLSKRCEEGSERTSEWPCTNVSIHGCSEP